MEQNENISVAGQVRAEAAYRNAILLLLGVNVQSWCDKLASVPGAGFRLDPFFASSDSIIDAFSPILTDLYRDDKPRFTVNQQQSFEIQFTTEDGFHYAVEPTKVAVTFRHRMRARPVSGGPPVMEMLSRPAPYTQLLPTVLKSLVEAAVLLPKATTRTISRVGIISTTSVAEDELPPGIARFIKYMGRPWKGDVEHFSFSITAETGKGAGYTDRCFHTITKPEDKEQLMTLNFDWQRIFSSSHPINSESLTRVAGEAEKAALKYFEDLAEGKRFDEELISATTGI